MAPVATRRSQLRKKKAASIKQRNAKDYLSTQISRESKQIAKATCFFDESLLACDICLEVMHNAMNVSPCNHKFCAGCIYEWNSLNTKCPKCRWSAADITRDTTLNSIIEQYLIAFPEKRRDAAQLIELDERELNHLEKWQRKGEIHEEGVSYGLGQHYLEVLESEDSDIFEPQDDQLEEDAEVESVLERTSSERWSDDDDLIDSYEDDDDEGDSDIQYTSAYYWALFISHFSLFHCSVFVPKCFVLLLSAISCPKSLCNKLSTFSEMSICHEGI
ncbi:hypothetical protein KIN20_033097 [Parelaphostrongylus tenuis]|uniref:RING-type domain-containing protein n=1 Tax=Parelaphostrongylus tenuis TaxID=148309 RepID=A0AAD5WIL0_PARTN|nr:hypothetical protein KIN20_033097 [Parelaphostrongylus tenuis]